MRRGGGDLKGLGQHPRNPTKPHAPGSRHGLLKATLAKLEQLAELRGMARVTVLCDLIDEAARVSVG